jgi:hypothetical protein
VINWIIPFLFFVIIVFILSKGYLDENKKSCVLERDGVVLFAYIYIILITIVGLIESLLIKKRHGKNGISNNTKQINIYIAVSGIYSIIYLYEFMYYIVMYKDNKHILIFDLILIIVEDIIGGILPIIFFIAFCLNRVKKTTKIIDDIQHCDFFNESGDLE